MNSTQSTNALAALIRDGMEHHRAGRRREAEGAYRRALAIDPGHPEALAVMGILMGQAGNLPAAAELMTRALKRDPRNPQIHYNLGETWRHLGEAAKAESSLRRAVELDPDHYDAYQSLIDLSLAEAARHEKTGNDRRAHELRLIAASLLVAVGQRMVIKDFRTAAVEKYRAAAALDPDNPVVWRGLGNALVQRPSEAEPALRRAIALDPENPWAYGALGDVLMALDRPAEAEAVYRQGLARAPGDMVCRQGLVWVKLTAPLYRPETTQAQIFEAHRAWGKEAVARADDRLAALRRAGLCARIRGRAAPDVAGMVLERRIGLKRKPSCQRSGCLASMRAPISIVSLTRGLVAIR